MHDEFVEALARRARQLSFAHPTTKDGQIGPIIFEKQAETIQKHIKDAVSKSATIVVGGSVQILGW